ncbi:MAG: SPOR domain-containing protein [Candidatus Puniceispirillales bacterium]
MNNYLKITIIIFLSTGILFSVGLFAIKIIFEENIYDELVVLGPDDKDIFTIPKDVGGKKVSNLNIEILNNKKALVNNDKLRIPPAEPELLPLDIIEEKIKDKTNNIKELKNNIIQDSEKKVQIPNKIKKKSKKKIGLYRVQFGSFRNLDKAKLAKSKMNKKFNSLLSNTRLEIYTYTNSENAVFYRVWTSPLNKVNGLNLCNQFKKQKILCILQVNK